VTLHTLNRYFRRLKHPEILGREAERKWRRETELEEEEEIKFKFCMFLNFVCF
jgi:hypothetical protein